MPSRELPIPFPLGGQDTSRGYQSSDPQTTRLAKNVVPDESQESRSRGGSRPGLTKRYETPLDGPPTFMVRVSAGDDTRVYEYLVVGTATSIYVGKSVVSGVVLPITYAETLLPISGEILTEDDVELTTEDDLNLIIDAFSLVAVDRNVVTEYAGTVVVGATDSVLTTNTGTVTPNTLDSTFVGDWSAIGIDTDIHWIEIESTNPFIDSGTYLIANLTAGSVTLNRNPINNNSGGPIPVTFTIRVGVRVLDPILPNIDLLAATAGYAPIGANAVAVYRDRLVWAIGRTWYMSRQGDPGDYDYGADPEDPARAIAGNASDAGQPADPIVAMASAGFDYLILFAENSIWNMRGDPGFGGQLFNISKTIGCVSAKAWCYGKSTEIYFLSKDGLYVLPPNASGIPQALSQDKLPLALRGIDRDNNFVTLAYDPGDDGVLIFVVPRDGTTGNHWWFSISTGSFWPIELSRDVFQPVDAVTFGGAPTRVRSVVIASFDGYLREWVGPTDDGLPIDTILVLGPFELASQNDLQGIIAEFVSTFDEDSGPLTLEFFVGSNSEQASLRAMDGTSPSFSVTVNPGRSYTIRPRLAGVAVCIRMTSSLNPWAFEGSFATFADKGKRR